MPNPQGELSIRTSGSQDDLLQLLDWFRYDDALRGRVTPRAPKIREDRLGDIYEVLQVALGSGGLGTALALSLRTWLINRRSDIKLTLTRYENGLEVESIEVDAKRANATDLVKQIEKLVEPPRPAPGSVVPDQ